MWTGNMFFVGAAQELKVRFRARKICLSPRFSFIYLFFFFLFFSTDRSRAVSLLQSSLLVRLRFHTYVAFESSLFVSHLSFCCCLGKAVIRECGISLVFLLIFLAHLSQRLL